MKPDTRQRVWAQMARDGDADAFGNLYALYYRELYQYALYILASPTQAQDAVHEAVLHAFDQVASLRSADAFRPWMFTILGNECKRQLRTAAAERHAPLESIDWNPAPAQDPALSLELQQALLSLPHEERQIVLLHTVAGCSSREIAAALSCPASTVRSKLKRSLAKLRLALQEPVKTGKDEKSYETAR